MKDEQDAKQLLGSTKLVARMLGVSVRSIHRRNASGQLPRPMKFGKLVRYRLDEMKAWVDAGMPCRDTWERQRRTTPD